MVAAATGGADPGHLGGARLRRIPGEAVDRAGNEHLMDAAAPAGAAAFVRLSVVGASAHHPMELFRAHLTLNEVAAIIAQLTGCRSVQHVPRSALRAMAIMTALVKPEPSRQARAALMMDTTDMSFDSAAARRAFPALPATAPGRF
jgi:hypothetical protein